MLTPAQIELRRSGVGASEVAALLDISPWSGPLDVWISKVHPELDGGESTAMRVGSALEDGLRRLAAHELGLRFRRSTTLRHRAHPHVLATPDGLAVGTREGVEIKVVSEANAHQWAKGVPDFVEVQAAVNLAVTGRDRWHVVALVGGTDLHFHVVERDDDREGALCEAVEAWWERHIVGEEPPDAMSAEERRRLLDIRFPRPDAGKLVARDDSEELAEAMRWLTTAERMTSALEEATGHLRAMILERVGTRYGVEAPGVGRMLWFDRKGNPDWKALALSLGATDADAERFRRPASRVPLFTPTRKALPR